MDDAVEDGVRDRGLRDFPMPAGHRRPRGDGHRAASGAVVGDPGRVARPGRVGGGRSPVVKDDDVGPGEIAAGPGNGALAVRGPQLGERPRNARAPGPEAFQARLAGERAGDPGPARAARAGDRDVGAVPDPGAVAEARDDAAAGPRRRVRSMSSKQASRWRGRALLRRR